MNYVVNPDATYKEVTNLGWLLRHYDEVEKFEVYGSRVIIFAGTSRGYFEIPDKNKNEWSNSTMVAVLKDGRKFVARWASYEVMLDWLRRPKFIGLPILWFGLETEIK